MTTPSSDEKLRDLERRFRQTGSPDDEAAWLLERVRVGRLSRDATLVAAGLGSQAAQSVAGPTLQVLRGWADVKRSTFEPVARHLSTHQLTSIVSDCAQYLLPSWKAAFADTTPEEAAKLIQAWGDHPREISLSHFAVLDHALGRTISIAESIAYPPSGEKGPKEAHVAAGAAKGIRVCLQLLASVLPSETPDSIANKLTQLVWPFMQAEQEKGLTNGADLTWIAARIARGVLAQDR